MTVAQVVGSIVASVKDRKLDGMKLLVVQPVGHDRQPVGAAAVAIDHTQAGRGDWVLIARGKDAGWPIGRETAVDLAVMAVLDGIHLELATSGRKE